MTPATHDARRIRLLIVDDDEGRRVMLATYFEKQGFDVSQLPDGARVIDRIHTHAPDVVLLDVMLPGETGIDIAKRIRALDEEVPTPVILMTAAATDEESIVRGLMMGADDYIITPAGLGEFNARVRVQVRNRRERERLRVAVTERALFEEEANRDALTGIANRRALDRELARAIGAGPLLLVLLDIDRFKAVNDTYGHPAGDAVLRHVADALSRMARQGDFIARFGGEEFAIVVPGASREVAETIGERYRRAIENTVFPEGVSVRNVTVSVGVASVGLQAGEMTPARAIAAADGALYAAKAGGRNCVRVTKA